MLVWDFFLDLNSKKIPIIVDQPKLIPLFEKYAEQVLSYNDFDFSQKNIAVLVLTSFDFLKAELKSFLEKNQSKVVLFLLTKHLAARHPSDHYSSLIDYSFNALLNSDILSCYDSVRKISSHFSQKVLLTHKTVVGDLSVVVNEVQTFSCKSVIEYGDVFLPYCLFEYALFQSIGAQRLLVNGRFVFNSMLVSAPFEEAAADENKNKLLHAINHSQSAILTIKENIIQSLQVDGIEFIDCLNRIPISKNIVEIAFGVNDYMNLSIDRAINSPLNEGIVGFHVGIGTGKNEYHIDFISSEINFNDFDIQELK